MSNAPRKCNRHKSGTFLKWHPHVSFGSNVKLLFESTDLTTIDAWKSKGVHVDRIGRSKKFSTWLPLTVESLTAGGKGVVSMMSNAGSIQLKHTFSPFSHEKSWKSEEKTLVVVGSHGRFFIDILD